MSRRGIDEVAHHAGTALAMNLSTPEKRVYAQRPY